MNELIILFGILDLYLFLLVWGIWLLKDNQFKLIGWTIEQKGGGE